MPKLHNDYALYMRLLGALIAIKDRTTVWIIMGTLIFALAMSALGFWMYLDAGLWNQAD